jgi:hypothetical protein
MGNEIEVRKKRIISRINNLLEVSSEVDKDLREALFKKAISEYARSEYQAQCSALAS